MLHQGGEMLGLFFIKLNVEVHSRVEIKVTWF